MEITTGMFKFEICTFYNILLSYHQKGLSELLCLNYAFKERFKARLHWCFLRRFLLRFCGDLAAISRRFQIACVNYWRFRGDLNRQ